MSLQCKECNHFSAGSTMCLNCGEAFTVDPPHKTLKQIKVENILSESDIVWGRYGTDSIELLAKRIIKELTE